VAQRGGTSQMGLTEKRRRSIAYAFTSNTVSSGRGGSLLWLVNSFIPMQGTIKSILNAVVIIAVVLWLLNVFGLFHSLSRIHVGT
jgi:hypothetical protein